MTITVFLIIVCVVNILLWLYFFSVFKKRFSPDAILKDIKIEVDKLLIEINRETDRDISLLNGRIAGLKALIAEADKKIALAESETHKRQKSKSVLSALHEAGSDKNTVEPTVEKKAEPKNPVQKKLSTYEQTPQLFPVENEVAVEVVIPKPLFEQVNISLAKEQIVPQVSIKDKILELDKVGFSVEMIAEKLSLSVAEVQFAIDLFRNQ